MLDRTKIMQELERVSGSLFFDLSDELRIAQRVWQEITADPTFPFKVRQAKTDWIIPTWSEPLDRCYAIAPTCENYTVYSVDGSQIYPDRHQGTSCSLINIGTVKLSYGQQSSVDFQSIPYVFTGDESAEFDNAVDWINCRRQEYELRYGIELVISVEGQKQAVRAVCPAKLAEPEGPDKRSRKPVEGCDKEKNDSPSILLYDGSLIFWHLNSENLEMHGDFLSSYLGSLYQLSQKQILFASYISSSKSKELTNLVRLQLCDFDETNEAHKKVEHLVDTHIVSFFLNPYERTTVFQNHSTISQSYPDIIKPHFFYLHNGDEIGRVEIPAWIAQDAQKVDLVAQLILDQCAKGYGYPVAIAEAHEQAVIKGPDREFFYQLVQRVGFSQKRSLRPSIKSMKKRRMGV